MEELDPAWVQSTLSSLPFVTIEGVSNVRSLGNYASATPVGTTKPNFMFRAGEISGITSTGKQQLQELGIKKVFDLRSDTELEKFGTPIPELNSDAQVLHVPVFKKEDYSPEMISRRYKLYASGKVEAFMELYSQILDHGVIAYGTIFKHIRDRPDEPRTSDGKHHTPSSAGKDRTGVLSALILKLAGVEDDTIAKDYALTRVGREPQRAVIMARLSKEPVFAENKEAAFNLMGSRHETMIAFLGLLKDKYGGVERYLGQNLGFSTEDITVIRQHLVIGAGL